MMNSSPFVLPFISHQNTVNEFIPLRLLTPGHIGRVAQLLGSAADVHRLQEMGLRKGVVIEMLQAGSPCIIRVAGSKLCIRDANLFQVLVEPAYHQAEQPVPSVA